MKIQEAIRHLQELAPLSYAEDFDNTGLLVGNSGADLTGILVTLDTLETVVEEAIEKKCNLIVSFHPIIFSGLKKITGRTYVERVVQMAIKNDIAIYAIHTALDNHWNGVNAKICEKLRLSNRQVLVPKSQTLQKLVTYVPQAEAGSLKKALFAAGAGNIGNYDHCSFALEGVGSFRGNEDANPTLGERGSIHYENETQLGVIFPKHIKNTLLAALKEAHPYEEVAYEIYTLENTHQHLGMGMIASWDQGITEQQFLQQLKDTFHCGCIKHSKLLGMSIKKVAVLGGSGSFAIDAAKAAGADAFVTADLKYHDYFTAEDQILLVDIGHYESEQYTKELLVDALKEKITNFAVVLSQINTNPITCF
ncbi:Nif3-like dinuclear metal center hexameric protein [Altibacter sp. HG106]|uniref:Nif3-like dinuclear metal center hexameric protein n=1 Tax=Altibacter sp. HG106 TaxID=3023937 RepID=UPI00234FF880|nr:Nif3-like dinuclear metal center hexameric protein [Altibacter sp. HG106]MDC7995859.1 Nif3-like dinuclear metal center hexameric protein [Altibacter sp. HG106]